jgi:hypothetical protein
MHFSTALCTLLIPPNFFFIWDGQDI